VAEDPPREATRDAPRRARDLALIVPALGTLALMPPLIGLFARPETGVFGIPLIVVYLFGLWLALILGALFVASRLERAVGTTDP